LNSSVENLASRDRLSDKSFNRILMEIVGPVLIMLMVGSLVFFLIEIFYRGPPAMRLGWVLGLFTAASVLVSRISIEEGLERASIFGFALAAATLYVTVTLVDFEYGALFVLEPVVVLLFIAVVMWSSNRLTWDCTVIDASRDVSSIGLAELVKRKLLRRGAPNRKSISESSTNQTTDQNVPAVSRWFFPFFANSQTQNTPGLWVFYFAMAAFPIFGFGQWFAQPSSDWGYRWIFLLFAIYLGSALGLLMLTSLLGLERYLRKRGAAMPANVSVNWMVIGTVFALAVMLIMLLLPSPSLSNAWQDALGFLTTNNKDTSVHAVGNDGQANGDDPKKEKQDQDAKGAKKKLGDKGAGKGDKGKGGDKKSDAKGNDSSGDKKSKSKSESDKNSESKQNNNAYKSKKSEQDESQEKSDAKNEKDKSEKSNNKQDQAKDETEKNRNQNRKNDPQKNQQQNKNEQQNARKANQRDAKPDEREPQANQRQGRKQNAEPPKPSSSRPLSRLASAIGSVMKYLVYGVGLVVLIVLLWMFREELAKLWAELFGKKERSQEPGKKKSRPEPSAKPLPQFLQFKDPFAHGSAAKWSPAQTIQYSFLALEAWARGHQFPREHDQTPLEFAKQLEQVDERVAADARQLADLMGESLYSGGAVSRSETSKLQRLWQSMNASAPAFKNATTVPDMQLVNETGPTSDHARAQIYSP
jgi:hypothetical protein